MLETYRLDSRIKEKELIGDWEKIVGKAIANRTTEVKVWNKKLYLSLNSAPLRKELQMSQKKLIALVNEYFQAQVIEEIVFK